VNPSAESGASMEWFGCATFRLNVDDLVVMLDAYIWNLVANGIAID